uniref:GAG-pre-integrase domain-containing protein n=1 Tax=Micrurus lemniscatus lemniscatus TaxID=129467 RepID=A0A2D4I771_MICLE
MQTWASLANGQRAAVKGEGNVYGPEIGEILYNVLYVPALDHNLLSISRLDRLVYDILFAGGQYSIKKNGKIHTRGVKKDGLYFLGRQEDCCACALTNAPTHDNCVNLLHRKLGHASFDVLKKMPGLPEGLRIKK